MTSFAKQQRIPENRPNIGASLRADWIAPER
jgi:hypothetical protein